MYNRYVTFGKKKENLWIYYKKIFFLPTSFLIFHSFQNFHITTRKQKFSWFILFPLNWFLFILKRFLASIVFTFYFFFLRDFRGCLEPFKWNVIKKYNKKKSFNQKSCLRPFFFLLKKSVNNQLDKKQKKNCVCLSYMHFILIF